MVSNRVQLVKALPGASANDAATSTSGLIVGGAAVAGKLELAKAYRVTNTAALADLGLDAAYDVANNCLAFYHITEFFRMAGEGTVLWLMILALNTTPGDVLDDTTGIYAKKLFVESGKEIRQIAIGYIPLVETIAAVRATMTYNVAGLLALPTATDIVVETDEPGFGTLNFGTYTKQAGDTTATILAANILAAIGSTNGYIMSANAGILQILAPASLGDQMNGVPVTFTYAGGSAFSNFGGGANSSLAPEVLVDGMNGVVRAAIPRAQAFWDWAYGTSNTSLQIFLEGRRFSGNAASVLNLRAIPSGDDFLQAHKVHIVNGQDWAYTESRGGVHLYSAAIGAALGSMAYVRIEQSMAEVQEVNLTNVIKNRFVTAGLSNHKTIAESETQLDTLDDKGYIFPIKYFGVSGFRWNDDGVCAPIIIDDEGVMNEHQGNYGRVMGEASRNIYKELVPKIKTSWPVDATTGKLGIGTIKYFEGLGNQVFDEMARSGHITAGDTKVDPNSDLFRAPKKLTVAFAVIPFGTIGRFQGTISLQTNF